MLVVAVIIVTILELMLTEMKGNNQKGLQKVYSSIASLLERERETILPLFLRAVCLVFVGSGIAVLNLFNYSPEEDEEETDVLSSEALAISTIYWFLVLFLVYRIRWG